MMFLLKNLKIAISVFFIACVLNYQVYAQVQTNQMKCYDVNKNVNFSVHFKGGEVFLQLKGHTYRVPYFESFVSSEGERWSVYKNKEIDVSTTAPYDAYVQLLTMPSGNFIATAFCD